MHIKSTMKRVQLRTTASLTYTISFGSHLRSHYMVDGTVCIVLLYICILYIHIAISFLWERTKKKNGCRNVFTSTVRTNRDKKKTIFFMKNLMC